MNVSQYYLTILLILGSQRTAQVWDRRHPSHHIPSQFSTISMHATSGRVFVHLRKCLTWPGFGVAVEAYIDWGGYGQPCTLLSLTSWRQLGQIMFFMMGTPPKQNHKVKLSCRMKLEETLCPRVFNLNQFISKPIAFRSLRFQVPRDVAMLLLAPNHVVHREWMSNIPFGTDVLARGWPHVFFLEIEAYCGSSQFFPVQFQVPGPVLSNYLRFDWMSTVYWCTLFWTLWC